MVKLLLQVQKMYGRLFTQQPLTVVVYTRQKFRAFKNDTQNLNSKLFLGQVKGLKKGRNKPTVYTPITHAHMFTCCKQKESGIMMHRLITSKLKIGNFRTGMKRLYTCIWYARTAGL